MSNQGAFVFACDVFVSSKGITSLQRQPYFEGPKDEPDRVARLSKQQEAIKSVMADGQWWTLQDIHEATGEPVASISAQLRHLRKSRWGSYTVNKRHIGHGLWEYQVLKPETTS